MDAAKQRRSNLDITQKLSPALPSPQKYLGTRWNAKGFHFCHIDPFNATGELKLGGKQQSLSYLENYHCGAAGFSFNGA